MSPFSSLARNRDFTILWAGQTVAELGMRVSGFVFPLIGFALSGSVFWAATVSAANLLGTVAMLLPAGLWADRHDRALLMRWAAVLSVVAYAPLALAGVLRALTLPHLLLAAAVAGAGTGLFNPAENSAVRSLVSDDELPTAYSQIQARENIASLLGAPLGGLLFGVARWLPFAFDAISSMVLWVMIGRIRTPLPGLAHGSGQDAGEHGGGALAEIGVGLRFSWGTPFFRVLLIWAPLMNLVGNALVLVAILRLITAGVSPGAIALVEVAAGAAGILGAAIAPWLIERTPTGMLSVVLAWFSVPMVIPVAVWNSVVAVAAMLVLVMLVNPAGNAGISAYRTAITPPELLGRTQSAMRFVSMAMMPLAPLLAGVLLGRFGGERAVLMVGAMLIGVALIPTLSRSVRTVPRPAHWRVEPVGV
jgi:MFS family permease